MKKLTLLALSLAALSINAAAGTVDRPNILLIVADDLGYSDIGAFGGEIQTPTLDNLAREGIQFTNFHATPSCSPTRSTLMTGVDPHLSGLGMMRETLEMSYAPGTNIRSGYQGVLRTDLHTLPEVLRGAGYHTYMAGKWHLGSKPDQQPQNRGFEHATALMEGGAAHFKQSAPMKVFENYSATFLEDGKPIEMKSDFYSTFYFTDKLIEYLDSQHKDGKPFFAWAAYTAPHWPLQAPQQYIDKYRSKYDEGYDSIAKKRLQRQKELGFPDANADVSTAIEKAPAWSDLSPDQQKRSAKTMEVYAGMIDALDSEIGRLLDHLKRTGEYDNTVIIFMSDNGAEGHGDLYTNNEWNKKNFSHDVESMGQPNSYVTLGAAWAQVSSTPNRLFKMTAFEGGSKVPAMIYFPKQFSSKRIDELLSSKDIMPTILELAGVKNTQPNVLQSSGAQGKSILAKLEGKQESDVSNDEVLGIELHRSAGLRKGDWKIVYETNYTGRDWQLYNLREDPRESTNLAKSNPDKLKELMTDWLAYAKENQVEIDSSGNPVLPGTPTGFFANPKQ